MSREAMKLALEALENSIDLVSQEARNAEELYGKYPTRLARIQGLVAFEVAHEKAITALREALAKPDFWEGYEPEPTRPAPMTKDEALDLALEVLESCEWGLGDQYFDALLVHKAITAIKQARAAPVQEPVAWAHKEGLEKINDFDASIYARGGFDDAVPLYTTPHAQPAPDCKETGVCVQTGLACFGQAAQPAPVQPVQEPVAKHYMDGGHLVYPAAQRQWFGLEREIAAAVLDHCYGHGSVSDDMIERTTEVIEAKLKEKNNG